MTTKYPCYIEFSDSGKYARIVHKNGTLLAELVIHGPFADRTLQAHVHQCACGHANMSHLNSGIAHFPEQDTRCTECQCRVFKELKHSPYLGECWGLSDYELIVNEAVVEQNGAKKC